MHEDILNRDQNNMLPFLGNFEKEYLLVGGTAIALYLGHRTSIDFDLMTKNKISTRKIDSIIQKSDCRVLSVMRKNIDEYTLIINNVKFTFFSYPFDIKKKKMLKNIIAIPDLLSLAAMKVYALGRRGKWKDYVDLFYLLKDKYSLDDIILKSKKIFKKSFNERIFREQLTYFDDIDMSEKIEFITKTVSEQEIKNFLIQESIK